jgi:hypothetical protein
MTASRHKNNREFDANLHPTGRLPDALTDWLNKFKIP